MKKLLAIALTLALALCLAVPAFAAEPDIGTNNGTASVKVNGTYAAGSAADEVISVDVSWGSMSFTYHDTVEGSWNDETHNFDGAVAAHWTCETDANKITVTNHSNVAIKAELSFAADSAYSGITGSFGKTSTKYFLHALLSAQYNVLATPGSVNTPLGLVRIIRENLKPSHEVFIAEMGAKNVGDIQELCKRIIIINDGRIIEDGSLDELIDRIAPYRELVIDFYTEQHIEHPKAEIVKSEGARTVYRFIKNDISAASLIEYIGDKAKIKDIKLEEANIDDIIRIAYNGEVAAK